MALAFRSLKGGAAQLVLTPQKQRNVAGSGSVRKKLSLLPTDPAGMKCCCWTNADRSSTFLPFSNVLCWQNPTGSQPIKRVALELSGNMPVTSTIYPLWLSQHSHMRKHTHSIYLNIHPHATLCASDWQDSSIWYKWRCSNILPQMWKHKVPGCPFRADGHSIHFWMMLTELVQLYSDNLKIIV